MQNADHWHLTVRSGNGKTGPIPVTTSPEWTCPPACPLKDNGCFGDNFRCRNHWNNVNAGTNPNVLSFAEFCEKIFALPDLVLWRHNQVGDLPGKDDQLNASMVMSLCVANHGKRGFTYTHYPVLPEDVTGFHRDRKVEVADTNLQLVRACNHAGFTVNLSANNISHADKLAATGLPVAVLLPEGTTENLRTPEGNKVVVCPAYTRDGVTCETCGLCARSDRTFIVGLPVHGTGRKKAGRVAAAA